MDLVAYDNGEICPIEIFLTARYGENLSSGNINELLKLANRLLELMNTDSYSKLDYEHFKKTRGYNFFVLLFNRAET
jgi:hypothetical protein